MASLAVTLIFAFMSWHLIEKRFLKKALKGK
jgi:peptidoglycan/LPS O-acetylase OafA/YrhL